MKFLDVISNENINFNGTEKRILEYLLEKSPVFSNIKITDMANELFLSSNTIIRLCKKLGYSGFSELKYDIINSNKITNNLQLDSSHISIHNSVIRTLSLNKPDDILKAATEIHSSNRVVIFSLGLSQYPAQAFCKKLQYFNKMCLVPEDRDENILFANNLKEGDLAFIISSSGSTDIMKKITGIIKTKNIYTISLTGFSQNFLSSLSDLPLFSYLKDYKLDTNDLTSRLGFNIVLDLIFEDFSKFHS